MGLVAEGVCKPLRPRYVGIEGMKSQYVVRLLCQQVEAFLHGDTAVLVFGVSVAVDHAEYGIHSGAGGGTQTLAIEQMADKNG